ncbi:MAG TPA: polysaccharide pyruvyl transferase family protein [Acidimicrobiia bacterium]|nr:polysaccharide pyruvyl transferase family protein [Acidimicrobiia bacterium]
MRRLLIRSGKVPFAAISPEQTLARNVIGTNSGNLAFSYATHRILQTPDTELVSNGFKVLVSEAGRINEEYGVDRGTRRVHVGVAAAHSLDAVDVIRCPSMFMYGPNFRVEKKIPALDRDCKIAINISTYVKRMARLALDTRDRYPKMMYVAQDIASLELMRWGHNYKRKASDPAKLVSSANPLYREDRMRFFVDPWTWFQYLSEFDFSFGTRIHGNISSLLAGTPAVVLAHDSRTLELARYHRIPHRLISELPADVDPADLYAEADFTEFNDGQRARFEAFADFLHRNDLEHSFGDPETTAAFDTRVAEVEFPGPVRPLPHMGHAELAERVEWLYGRMASLDKDKRVSDISKKQASTGRAGTATQQSGEPPRRRAAPLCRLARKLLSGKG